MAYNKNLSRGLQSAINETPIEDGKLRFTVDTARIYLDLKNERIEFTDFVKGLTGEEIRNLQNPLPKMYLSSDTHELLFYHDEEWISFGGGGVDDLGQVIHKTYIKEIKFENNDLVYVMGDNTERRIENDLFETILDRLDRLEQDYTALREDHEALVEAVTKWGEIEEIPESLARFISVREEDL
jgi:hypothetical protein